MKGRYKHRLVVLSSECSVCELSKLLPNRLLGLEVVIYWNATTQEAYPIVLDRVGVEVTGHA